MDDEEQKAPGGEAQPAPEGEGHAAPAGEAGPAPDANEPPPQEKDGGGRLLAAAVTLPWLFLYGVTGVWAVTLAARAASQGLKRLDAGYTRFVTPPALAFVGALLLAAFAVLLACGLLLLFRRRSAATWLPLTLVAAGLTAGAVWAGIRGGLHPLFWLFLFFGLVYATVVGCVRVLQVTGAERRDTIGPS
jgi:hypothetical protein